MSSFFPPKANQARAKGPKRKRKLQAGSKEEGGQALLLLIKKTTSVRRRAAPKAVDAEGKGDAAETEEEDKACWTELKKMLRGGDETLARQAFGFLVGQLRDRRAEVRRACILCACMIRLSGIAFLMQGGLILRHITH
jgi:hypothetical protein